MHRAAIGVGRVSAGKCCGSGRASAARTRGLNGDRGPANAFGRGLRPCAPAMWRWVQGEGLLQRWDRSRRLQLSAWGQFAVPLEPVWR